MPVLGAEGTLTVTVLPGLPFSWIGWPGIFTHKRQWIGVSPCRQEVSMPTALNAFACVAALTLVAPAV